MGRQHHRGRHSAPRQHTAINPISTGRSDGTRRSGRAIPQAACATASTLTPCTGLPAYGDYHGDHLTVVQSEQARHTAARSCITPSTVNDRESVGRLARCHAEEVFTPCQVDVGSVFAVLTGHQEQRHGGPSRVGVRTLFGGTQTAGRVLDNGQPVSVDVFVDNATDLVMRGVGFQAGTPMYVSLFSEPRYLGQLTVNADGTFEGAVNLGDIDPGQVPTPEPGVLLATGTSTSTSTSTLRVLPDQATPPTSFLAARTNIQAVSTEAVSSLR
jgi:hypothetical protein